MVSFPIAHETVIPPSISPLMSHTHSTSTSSSNFQSIFDTALKEYNKRTKKDLLTHPLATQLEDCDSPSSILHLLQQQVQDLNETQRRDERWTKWLDTTVEVLYGFSQSPPGEAVTSVCLGS